MRAPNGSSPIRGSLIALGLLLSACASGGSPPPSDAKAQLAFGVSMARPGLWAEADFRFEQAPRPDPGNARVLNNLAIASEALGRFDKAQKVYQEALRLDPGNAELKRNYARFIEFYQAYSTPAEEPGSAAAPAPPATTGGDP